MIARGLLAAAPYSAADPLAFYTVTATIIPVLFLALLFQANLLEQSPMTLRLSGGQEDQSKEGGTKLTWLESTGDDAFAVFFALYMLAITAIGEHVSLHVLLIGKLPGHEGRHVVALSIYASTLTLLFQQLALGLSTRRKTRDKNANLRNLRFVGTTLYFIALAVGATLIVY